MKKAFALLLALVMVFSLVACAQTDDTPDPVEPDAVDEPNTTPDPDPVEVTGVKNLVILNNAFDGLETSSQCYNAKEWHKAYSLGEFIDDNFWFTPAEDTTVLTVAYTDFYTDECALDTFRQKLVSFARDNEEYDYELFVGPAQKESSDVTYKGYCVVDKEVILFMQAEDSWIVSDLFEYVSMADADAYDFVCADGWSETISKENLAQCEIYLSEDGSIDATSVEYPAYGLSDIRYIVPAGMDANSEPAAEGVSKINVALNGEGIYQTEPPYLGNRAGTYYNAWSVVDLLNKFDVPACDTVKVVSYLDGYTAVEDYALFTQKYIAYQALTEKASEKEYFTLGQVQAKGDGVTNVGYYIFDEAAMAYIPADGLTAEAAFEAVGMADAENYVLTYTNGTSETKSADEVKAMELTTDLLTIAAA